VLSFVVRLRRPYGFVDRPRAGPLSGIMEKRYGVPLEDTGHCPVSVSR
jgi:hypothetical protein